MFVDEANLILKAGDGGDGIVAWRREKFVPLGGPAGGNGGRGGDIILTAKDGVNSLLDFRNLSIVRAFDGTKGQTKGMHGKNGEPKVLHVPVGTLVEITDENGKKIVDLTEDGQSYVVCQGGAGGFGNNFFKSSQNRAPERATLGREGEQKHVKLTLRLMADVGLLGFPNAGKSTLLANLTNAKPKIADYPFTTIKPSLGICVLNYSEEFVIADIPGLISGASEGLGLGFRFLQHLERVSVLCHLIDGYVCEDEENESYLIAQYEKIREELLEYNKDFISKPEVVVLNKADLLTEKQENMVFKLKDYLAQKGITLLAISALSGQGVAHLKRQLYDMCFANWDENKKNKKQISEFNPLNNMY